MDPLSVEFTEAIKFKALDSLDICDSVRGTLSNSKKVRIGNCFKNS